MTHLFTTTPSTICRATLAALLTTVVPSALAAGGGASTLGKGQAPTAVPSPAASAPSAAQQGRKKRGTQGAEGRGAGKNNEADAASRSAEPRGGSRGGRPAP
jgi:hypothetical protein